MRSRRFWFANWAITCISVVTIIQNIPADEYKFMVLAVVGGFLGFQTFTDIKKVNNGV